MSLAEAKAAAKAMVQGAVGDYSISNPIAHLHGLTARLVDTEAAEQPGTLDSLRRECKRAPGLTSQEVSVPAGCLNHNPSVSRNNPCSKRNGPGRG